MDYSDPEETVKMKCSFDGCQGQYEATEVTHTVRRDGQVIVIDHVPSEVCSSCGDVLLNLDTVRRIERMLEEDRQPSTTVPLYEFA